MQAVVMMANISIAGCAPAISQAFAKQASFKVNVRAGLFQENRLARFLELPASTSSSAFSLLQVAHLPLCDCHFLQYISRVLWSWLHKP
jgi:hypothetical protein